MEAVKVNGDALEFASEIFKDDRDIVLKAVKKSVISNRFASGRL